MVQSKRLRASIIFLFAALVGYWGFLSLAWHQTDTVTLNVSAFKSHHWLYGEHYLYRVLVEDDLNCAPQDSYACLDPLQTAAHPFDSSCRFQMRGVCRGDNHFVTHASRFYIPMHEKEAGRFYHQRGSLTLMASKLGPVFVRDFKF